MTFEKACDRFRYITAEAENLYFFLFIDDYDVDARAKPLYLHEVSYPALYTYESDVWFTLQRMRNLCHNRIFMDSVKGHDYKVKEITHYMYVIWRNNE